MTVRAVLLDLDDTLVPDERAAMAAFRQTCRRAAEVRRLDPERLRWAVRWTARRIWKASSTGAYGRGMGLSSWEALWGTYVNGDEEYRAFGTWTRVYRRRAWEEALRSHRVIDPVLALDLSRTFVRERRRRLRPFSDAVPAIEALRERLALAIVTNGAPDQQREKLARSGLAGLLPVVVISGEVGARKPDPRPFETALERLGVARDEAVVVGNSLNSDVRGARNAGIRAIWLDRPGRGAPEGDGAPDEVIRSLAELPDRLCPR